MKAPALASRWPIPPRSIPRRRMKRLTRVRQTLQLNDEAGQDCRLLPAFHRPLGCSLTQFGPQGRIVGQLFDRARQPGCIAGIDHQPAAIDLCI